MSHITRVRTRLKDGTALLATLRGMGFHIFRGDTLRGHPVEFCARKPGMTLGFWRREELGEYEVLGDWAQVRGGRRVVDRILQAYARDKVLASARRRGYVLVRNERNAKGEIRLTLRKIA